MKYPVGWKRETFVIPTPEFLNPGTADIIGCVTLLWRAVLCAVGQTAMSLSSMCQIQKPPSLTYPSYGNQNVPWAAKLISVENHSSRWTRIKRKTQLHQTLGEVWNRNQLWTSRSVLFMLECNPVLQTKQLPNRHVFLKRTGSSLHTILVTGLLNPLSWQPMENLHGRKTYNKAGSKEEKRKSLNYF